MSKKKRRFQEDGFDLDLSYVLPRLIAMGFPSSGVEGLYRNPVDQVVEFFRKRHTEPDTGEPLYKVYNLCSERDYKPSVFQNSLAIYPFDDHNPPPLATVRTICDDIHEWLESDPRHVAAVHCKAGKGRTGMVICAYLLHCGTATTAEESQAIYAGQRTLDGKGVTIPSQKRYIGFYAQQLAAARDPALHERPPAWLRGGDPRFVPTPVRYCRRLVLSHTPRGCGDVIYFKVFTGASPKRLIFDSRKAKKAPRARASARGSTTSVGGGGARGAGAQPSGPTRVVVPRLVLERVVFEGTQADQCRCVGDFRVIIYTTIMGRDKKLLQFWFHSAFIENDRVLLTKPELDSANKDKKHKVFNADFHVAMDFLPERAETGSPWSQQRAAAGVGGDGQAGGEEGGTGGSVSVEAVSVDVDGGAGGNEGGSGALGEGGDAESSGGAAATAADAEDRSDRVASDADAAAGSDEDAVGSTGEEGGDEKEDSGHRSDDGDSDADFVVVEGQSPLMSSRQKTPVLGAKGAASLDTAAPAAVAPSSPRVATPEPGASLLAGGERAAAAEGDGSGDGWF